MRHLSLAVYKTLGVSDNFFFRRSEQKQTVICLRPEQ